ncbi:MAG: recombinase family protein [Parcubacteria group bacterium]|jgi:DNA invertase Pin-like site-specific DNA recombinase
MADTTKNKNTYVLYVRKSSEEEDRQVLSIESQTNELKKIATKFDLKIVKTIQESKSAKATGRNGFNEMISFLASGKANGILCWKLDRLARNMVDGGTIIDMLQRQKINHIRTHDRDYFPAENSLLLAVEFGMANQFIRDLSNNAKRGLRTKAEKGWLPGVAKPGYLNEKGGEQGDKKIIIDPKGFSLIKMVFDKMLTGLYRPAQVLDMLNNEWGYRSPKRKKSGGKPMAVSAFYSLLSDPFYCGDFEYPAGSENWYKGKHQPMITPAEFDTLQRILGKKDNPRPRISHTPDTAFYGLFRCADCGSVITPDQKTQTICTKCKYKFSSIHKKECPQCGLEITNMENPTELKYTYYGCTKKKNPDCNQMSIELKKLDKQVVEILSGIKISENIKNWYIKNLNEYNEQEVVDRSQIQKSLQENYNDCQKRLDNLLALKISPQNTKGEILSDEDFFNARKRINSEMLQVKEKIDDTEDRASKWTDMAIDAFNFACYASYHYEHGDVLMKKSIILGFGSNLLIKDGELIVSLPKHLELIKNSNSRLQEIGVKLEPKNFGERNEKTGFVSPVFSTMHAYRDLAGTHLKQWC